MAQMGKKNTNQVPHVLAIREPLNSKVLLGVAQWGALEVKVKKTIQIQWSNGTPKNHQKLT